MQSNMMNTAMRNGLVLGVLFSVNFLLTATGIGGVVMLSYLVTAIIIYYTYRFAVQYRDRECEGSITFFHGFSFVFMLYIFATIISSFVKYFYLKFSKTNFLDDMYNQNIKIFEQLMPTVSDEMYQAMEMLTNPRGYTMMAAWSNVLMAVVIGLIIAGVVKRNKDL